MNSGGGLSGSDIIALDDAMSRLPRARPETLYVVHDVPSRFRHIAHNELWFRADRASRRLPLPLSRVAESEAAQWSDLCGAVPTRHCFTALPTLVMAGDFVPWTSEDDFYAELLKADREDPLENYLTT